MYKAMPPRHSNLWGGRVVEGSHGGAASMEGGDRAKDQGQPSGGLRFTEGNQKPFKGLS